jgi:hypothetical protein
LMRGIVRCTLRERVFEGWMCLEERKRGDDEEAGDHLVIGGEMLPITGGVGEEWRLERTV